MGQLEDILKHQKMICNNIMKSFGVETSENNLEKSFEDEINPFEMEAYKTELTKAELDEFEKAKHQDGDMHPNGKWVWRQSANGGKGDWRVAKPSRGGGSKVTAVGQAASIAAQENDEKQKTIDWDDISVTKLDDGGLYTSLDKKREIITIGSKQFRVDLQNKSLTYMHSGVKLKSNAPEMSRFKKLLDANKAKNDDTTQKPEVSDSESTEKKTMKNANKLKTDYPVSEEVLLANESVDDAKKAYWDKKRESLQWNRNSPERIRIDKEAQNAFDNLETAISNKRKIQQKEYENGDNPDISSPERVASYIAETLGLKKPKLINDSTRITVSGINENTKKGVYELSFANGSKCQIAYSRNTQHNSNSNEYNKSIGVLYDGNIVIKFADKQPTISGGSMMKWNNKISKTFTPNSYDLLNEVNKIITKKDNK